MFKKYKKLSTKLSAYEDDVFKQWTELAEKTSLDGLERPLLVRSANKGTLRVNFGGDTMAILSLYHIFTRFPSFLHTFCLPVMD